MIVPGSGLVRAQAEEEGLADIFKEAGFEWRMAGCSMCLAMNPDQLAEGERCASTSNRNFEGRQGYKGRTHLVSPGMAAAAAITGRLTDVRRPLCCPRFRWHRPLRLPIPPAHSTPRSIMRNLALTFPSLRWPNNWVWIWVRPKPS